MNPTSFGRALSSRGINGKKNGGVKVIQGMSLTDEGTHFVRMNADDWGGFT